MVGRARTRSYRERPKQGHMISGGFSLPKGTIVLKRWYAPTASIEDVVGNPYGDNPLTIVKQWLNSSGVNGKGTSQSYEMHSVPTQFELTSTYWGSHANIPSSAFRDATQAIMEAHPGDPSISYPNMLYELKDLPSMFEHAFDRAQRLRRRLDKHGIPHRRPNIEAFARRRGEDWLNYVFGWKPLISDLLDVWGISDEVIKRQKQLEKAAKSDYITTRVKLGTFVNSSDTSGNIYLKTDDQISVRATIHRVTTAEQWAVAKWSVLHAPYGGVLEPTYANALRMATGVNSIIPTQVWDALPWSWLVDWCVNFRAYQSMNWINGFKFKSATVMRTTISESTPQNVSTTNGYTYSGSGGVITKTRVPFAPTFIRTDLGRLIMSPGKLGILASLKVTRGAGSSRF